VVLTVPFEQSRPLSQLLVQLHFDSTCYSLWPRAEVQYRRIGNVGEALAATNEVVETPLIIHAQGTMDIDIDTVVPVKVRGRRRHH